MRPPLVPVEVECFDRGMALDVMEDALSVLDTREDRAMVFGLCGAFYMCGFLSHAEWEAMQGRIWETGGAAVS